MRCALAVLVVMAQPAPATCVKADGNWVTDICLSAERDGPAYGHDVLGDTPEWTELSVNYGPGGIAAAVGVSNRLGHTVTFAHGIFEDIAPRIVDIDADGQPEAIVVQTDFELGARLLILGFGPEPFVKAATPYIGQPNRWLAPVGVADLDGDGAMDVAYIDRPHLDRILRVWRYGNGQFTEVAALTGLTNHRIGENSIGGGIRDCGDGPEIVLANADWSAVMAVRLASGTLTARRLGAYLGPASLQRALDCGG